MKDTPVLEVSQIKIPLHAKVLHSHMCSQGKMDRGKTSLTANGRIEKKFKYSSKIITSLQMYLYSTVGLCHRLQLIRVNWLFRK